MGHMSQERTNVSSNFLSRLLVTDHSSAAATTTRVFHLQSLSLPSIHARPPLLGHLRVSFLLTSTTTTAAYGLSIEICCKVAVTDATSPLPAFLAHNMHNLATCSLCWGRSFTTIHGDTFRLHEAVAAAAVEFAQAAIHPLIRPNWMSRNFLMHVPFDKFHVILPSPFSFNSRPCT